MGISFPPPWSSRDRILADPLWSFPSHCTLGKILPEWPTANLSMSLESQNTTAQPRHWSLFSPRPGLNLTHNYTGSLPLWDEDASIHQWVQVQESFFFCSTAATKTEKHYFTQYSQSFLSSCLVGTNFTLVLMKSLVLFPSGIKRPHSTQMFNRNSMQCKPWKSSNGSQTCC